MIKIEFSNREAKELLAKLSGKHNPIWVNLRTKLLQESGYCPVCQNPVTLSLCKGSSKKPLVKKVTKKKGSK